MKSKGILRYMFLAIFITGILLNGCGKESAEVVRNYQVSKEELSYALPKIGEAEIIDVEMPKGAKGTISVATVGSPNTEILQEAAKILEAKGYDLKIEVCQDYLLPNQLVQDGEVDCNYYQHEAFLERYNIEKQTDLRSFAKIHYEPMAIFSEKVSKTKEISKGAKVAVPDNPTALAQALWLLQQEGLLTLMKDADLNAVEDDILENPLELELISMKEEEIIGKLGEVDLGLCHMGYTLKEGIEWEDILLVIEEKDSLAAESLSQAIIVKEYPNENAEVLTEVLMSVPMQEFIEKQYQGSIYRMEGKTLETIQSQTIE